jgi:hypothetical protein
MDPLARNPVRTALIAAKGSAPQTSRTIVQIVPNTTCPPITSLSKDTQDKACWISKK